MKIFPTHSRFAGLVPTALALAAVFALASVPALADNRNWQGGSATWDNSNTASWVEGVVPTNGDDVFLTESAAAAIDIAFEATNLTDPNALNNLTIGNAGGGLTTLNIGTGEALDYDGVLTLNANSRLLLSGGTVNRHDGTPTFGFEIKGGTLRVESGAFNYGWDGVLPLPPSTSPRLTHESGGLEMTGGSVTLSNHWNIGGSAGAATATFTGGNLLANGSTTIGVLNAANNATVSIGGTAQTQFNSSISVGTGAGPGHHELNLTGGSLKTVGTGIFLLVGKQTGEGSGTFNYSGGDTELNTWVLHMAETGTVNVSGPDTAILNFNRVWMDGGQVNQTGGTLNSTASPLEIGRQNGRSAEYDLQDGRVRVHSSLLIGNVAGSIGTLIVEADGAVGIRTNARNLRIGATSGTGSGTLILRGGKIGGNNDLASVNFGTGGIGTEIHQTGEFRGYGTLIASNHSTINFRMDGQVIADGYGSDQDLTITWAPGLLENNANTGDSGWYAVNQGRLTLADVAVASGNSTALWGDASSDISLVNSAKLAFTNNTAGNLTGSLLAIDRSDLPTITFFGDIVSVHSFQSNFTFDSLDMTIRFDDAAVSDVDMLRMYHFTGGSWNLVTDFTVDALSSQFTGQNIDSFSYFALAVVPEPSTSVLLLGAAGAMALLRRRRSALIKH